MLPRGYIGLLVADTRRAVQWERGLRGSGFDVARVETRGPVADKGSWQLGVRAEQGREARAFVSDVLAGTRRLPSAPLLSPSGWVALVTIVAVLAAWLGLGLLG